MQLAAGNSSAHGGSHRATTSLVASAPKEACVALFMEMELTSSLPGRPWILGIPLLRAYKARFDRSRRTVGLAKLPLGSEHCTGCSAPVAPPAVPHKFFTGSSSRFAKSNLQALASKTMSLNSLQPEQEERAKQQQEQQEQEQERRKRLRMSLRNLRVPSWLRQAQYEHSRGRKLLV